MTVPPIPERDPLPTDLLATIRDEDGSSTVVELDAMEGPLPSIDKPQPGAQGQQRYVIESLIGSGATSYVFAADDLVFDRRIAIKYLVGAKANDPKRVGRFMREAKLTAALEHPNIAPIYDLDFTPEGGVYFSMRMIGGRSMGAAILDAQAGRASPVTSPYEVVNVLLRVCEALSCAHGKGIIHRDIKPENIMLGAFGEVVLVDWGSAITVEEKDAHHGRLIGTPMYMSPQQARGESVDARSDVYSLGATLFHGLTRRNPTSARNLEEFWERKRAGEIDPPTADELARIPPALMDIALMAMDPDLEHRYQTIDEMAGDLRRWQAGLAVSAHRESLWERTRRGFRQYGGLIGGILIVLIAVLGSAALVYGERLKEIADWGRPIATETFNGDGWQSRWIQCTGKYEVEAGKLVSRGDRDSTMFFAERLGGGIAIEYDGRILPDKPPGDLSVVWSEVEPKPGMPNHSYPFRYRIQVGAYDNSFAQIEESSGLEGERGKTRLSYSPFCLEQGRTHHIRVEIESERIAMSVDGTVVCAADLDIPIGMGYVGIYSYYEGKSYDNLRIFAKGVPERISSLALGDRDMREGLFMRAAQQYAQVAHAHPGRPIAQEALYRQGYALARVGDAAGADRVWSQVQDKRLVTLIGIQRLDLKLGERNFPEVAKAIRLYAAEYPEMRQRLARLWSGAADLSIQEPDSTGLELLSIYDQYLRGALAGGDAAARLLNALGRQREVIEKFPKLPVETSQALIALGRADEMEKRFPTNRHWMARALLAQGKFDKVLAMPGLAPWARHMVLNFRDQKRPELGEFEPAELDRQLRHGEALRVVEDPSRRYVRIRALTFVDRYEEAIALPIQDGTQRAWLVNAACLAGRDDVVLREMHRADRDCICRASFWLALRTCASGDLTRGRTEMDAIQVPQGWYASHDLFIAQGFIRPFLASIAGDRAPFAAVLDEYSRKYKGTFEQRLWYAAEYISGRMDDESFLAQPVAIHRVGFLAFCKALRAEWEGRQEAAAEAYRAYLALPPHQRLIVWNDRDPCAELFAAWRAKALSDQPAR